MGAKHFGAANCRTTDAPTPPGRRGIWGWPSGPCARVLLPVTRERIKFYRMTEPSAAGSTQAKNRRSKRLPLSIPVRVYGRTLDNQPFRDFTETKSVSVHGGLLPIAARVKRGQTLLLVHGFTDEERECRVVYVESKRRKRKVGVEFTEVRGDFWHVYPALVDTSHAVTNLRKRRAES